jgi:hypothetical protein
MKLNRRSKLVRWAYFLNDDYPDSTSLCVFFWRVVLVTPAKIAVCVGIVALMSWSAFQLCKGAVICWNITLPALGALLFIAYIVHVTQLSAAERKTPSLLKEFIKAKKDKVCPVIEFE